jgi:hypothetical protein
MSGTWGGWGASQVITFVYLEVEAARCSGPPLRAAIALR